MKKFFTNTITFFRRIGLMLSTPAPVPSSQCSNINALLLHLCDFDNDLHMWVLRWLAYPLRNPGAKMSTCILVNGSEGSGKTMFFRDVMVELYGDAGRIVRPEQLKAHTLQWTEGAQFVAIDGDYSSATMQRLKHLVSDSAVYAVAANKREAVLHPATMNFVFMTGALDFLPAHVTTRRFIVIEAPPPQQRRFYEAARHEIDNGGVEAFREYLATVLDMGDVNVSTPAPAARTKAVA